MQNHGHILFNHNTFWERASNSHLFFLVIAVEHHIALGCFPCWPFCAETLTHWSLGDLDAILKLQFSILVYWLVSSHHPRIMPWDECQGTTPMISQHWCPQATSHYLSQCWPSSMSPYGVTRPKWVNVTELCRCHPWLLMPCMHRKIISTHSINCKIDDK